MGVYKFPLEGKLRIAQAQSDIFRVMNSAGWDIYHVRESSPLSSDMPIIYPEGYMLLPRVPHHDLIEAMQGVKSPASLFFDVPVEISTEISGSVQMLRGKACPFFGRMRLNANERLYFNAFVPEEASLILLYGRQISIPYEAFTNKSGVPQARITPCPSAT